MSIQLSSDLASEKPPLFRQALLLSAAGMAGVVAVMPYVMELMSEQLREATEQTGISTAVLIAISILQSCLYVAAATVAGLWAARGLGLRAPVSEAVVQRQPIGALVKEFAVLSLIAGTTAGILVVVLDRVVFQPRMPDVEALKLVEPALWKGALASFYGGITEELISRLFLLSLLGRLLTWISRTRVGLPTWIFWTANVAAALVFGLGHLPATASLSPLTPVLVTRALALNGSFGLVMGWLFWKRGLESAMLAHGAGDIVLHVVTPAVLGAVTSN